MTAGAMKAFRAFLGKTAVCLAWIMLLGIVSLPLSLVVVELVWAPGACITETRQEIANLSGFDFEISETDCDAIAKTASISVLVSTAGGHEKALLFKYVPADDGTLLPSIAVSAQGGISISISKVASIYSKIQKWNNSSVDYDIGYVHYPDPVDTEKKPK